MAPTHLPPLRKVSLPSLKSGSEECLNGGKVGSAVTAVTLPQVSSSLPDSTHQQEARQTDHLVQDSPLTGKREEEEEEEEETREGEKEQLDEGETVALEPPAGKAGSTESAPHSNREEGRSPHSNREEEIDGGEAASGVKDSVVPNSNGGEGQDSPGSEEGGQGLAECEEGGSSKDGSTEERDGQGLMSGQEKGEDSPALREETGQDVVDKHTVEETQEKDGGGVKSKEEEIIRASNDTGNTVQEISPIAGSVAPPKKPKTAEVCTLCVLAQVVVLHVKACACIRCSPGAVSLVRDASTWSVMERRV